MGSLRLAAQVTGSRGHTVSGPGVCSAVFVKDRPLGGGKFLPVCHGSSQHLSPRSHVAQRETTLGVFVSCFKQPGRPEGGDWGAGRPSRCAPERAALAAPREALSE